MDIESYPIDKRVFHVDDECYIIYLGSSREDYKPFLRIGNTEALNQKIISNTYNIIVTDSYTGNPAMEPGNINTEHIEENRYVGDKETVRKFLQFLKNFNKETSKITQYQDMKVKDGGALVSFFDDSNIQLSYDKRLIFDLKSRERKDLHYIEKTKWIQDQFSKNGLSFRPADFRFPGFILLKHGSVLFFNSERIIAFHLPSNYYHAFVKQGIDPDLISALITEDVTGSVIQLFKRKQYKKEKIDILSMNTALLGSALELFESSGIKSKIFDLKKGKVRDLLGYTISAKEARLTFTHKGIPFPISLSEEVAQNDKPHLNLNPVKMTLAFKKSVSTIAQGIPYIFSQEEPTKNRITESYFSELMGFFSGLLSPSDSVLVKHLESFFKDIESDTKFYGNYKNVKGGLRRLKPRTITSIYYLLNNARGICDLLAAEKDNNPEAIRALTTIKGNLNRILFAAGSVDVNLPLLCNIYLSNGNLFPMFRLMRDTVTPDEYSLSQDINKGIDEKINEKIEFFNEERQRLNMLIDELGLPAPPKEKPKPEELKSKVDEGKIKPEEGKYKHELLKPRVEKEVFEAAQKEAEDKKKARLKWIIIPVGALVVVAAVLLFLLLPEKGPSVTEGEEIALVEEAEAVPKPSIQESEIPPLPNHIRITILDIYLLTNKIARENDFRELDSPAELGRDPDWIYPGNVFTLPDNTVYTVVDGDTIWYIAHRYIRKTLNQDWERYVAILKELDEKEDVLNNKEKYISDLEDIKQGSYSENFKKEVDRTIIRLQ